ncbi:MAG: YraN family protein [SAR324 cluster bacterium]|nr:YraN family protein [SAR324 cluster bacterium]
MSDERKKIGSIGEKLASDYLERIGYSILQRNFRCRFGEIDIIACNSEYLVFCEVKTRKGSAPLHPSLSVTEVKCKRIRELAGLYLIENEDETRQSRFDVMSVIMNQNREGTVEHLENAF